MRYKRLAKEAAWICNLPSRSDRDEKNSFSPNGDNINDYFYIQGEVNALVQDLFIYDRWGEMVFSSEDRFFQWNGGYNNDISRPLPPGTYSYVVQYIGSYRKNEGVKEKRGGVALIR